ncbi:MAG: hypothetical protein EA393_04665 [Bacteroidetes bacterium]|nr:MAG: hypothetical protein EA393_04665 [Bacteroidota bacterium]
MQQSARVIYLISTFIVLFLSGVVQASISNLSQTNIFRGDTIPAQDTLLWDAHALPIDTILQRDTLPVTENDTLPEITERPAIPVVVEVEDELPASAIPWFSEEQLQNPFQLEPNFVDTNLLGFQHYDFAARSGFFRTSKGNIGHAYNLLVFDPELAPGLNMGHTSIYGHNIIRHDHLKYYRPQHVFTDLFLTIGSEREQLFQAKHTQRLHETFYLGFQYRVINSLARYFSRLASQNVNMSLTADYLSPDKRYQALGSFVINRMRNQQSGGLINPAAFEENQESDSVFLYRAESWYRDVSFNLRHFYQTGFYTGGGSDNDRRFINLGRINHDFTYSRNSFVFDENNSPYPFFDFEPVYPNSTFDSTVVHRIKNQVSWSNFPLQSGRGTFPFNFRLYLQYNINTIEQPDFPEDKPILDTLNQKIYYYDKYNYNEIVQGFELQSDQTRFLSFGGFANFTIGGYNDEDFHAGAYLNLGRPDRNYSLEGKLRVANMEAPYFYNNFRSNYITWENEFDKMQVVNLRGRLKLPWVNFEGNYFLLNNMVYFGSDALPVQNTSAFSMFSLGAYSDIEIGNFGFRNHGVYQYSTTSQFYQYPSFISYHSLYYNLVREHRVLVHQFGFDFHFNTGYKAMSWMPVTRAFYAQDEHNMRDKFLLDVFWTGKIKRARLFLKYQNILGLVFDIKPHYDIPFYPIPETMFKFGVSWMFFD